MSDLTSTISTVRSTVESTAKSVTDTVSSTASAVAESVTTYVHKGVEFADAKLPKLPEVSYPASLPTPAEVVDAASALVTSVAAKLPFVDVEAPADEPAPAKPVNATKATKATKTTKATKKSA